MGLAIAHTHKCHLSMCSRVCAPSSLAFFKPCHHRCSKLNPTSRLLCLNGTWVLMAHGCEILIFCRLPTWSTDPLHCRSAGTRLPATLMSLMTHGVLLHDVGVVQGYKCQQCGCVFCVDCDLFVHETMHSCPGCASSRQTNTWSTDSRSVSATAQHMVCGPTGWCAMTLCSSVLISWL